MLRVEGEQVYDGNCTNRMMWEHRRAGGFVGEVSREGFPEELILALSFEG